MKDEGFNDVLWLDISALSQGLLKSYQQLEVVKYFTARISGNPDKQKRQTTYLDALGTIPIITTFYGKFLNETRKCPACRHRYPHPNEKMTDVNIATQIMCDAFQDKFDTAIIISGDSDQTPPIKAVRELFPEKKIIICFPPGRVSNELRSSANGSFHIKRRDLLDAQLPESIKLSNGYTLKRPDNWV